MSPEVLAKATSKNGYIVIQLVLCVAYKSAFNESKQYTAFGGLFDVRHIGRGAFLAKDIPLDTPDDAFILVQE